MSDFLDELADQAADLTGMPSEEGQARLREMGEELVGVDGTISSLEDQLKIAKDRRNEIVHKQMPELMNELDVDHLGIASAGVDIELSAYYKASIPKDWDEERRQAGFAHLEELGAGDIIRSVITISAGKGDLDNMKKLLELIQLIMQLPYEDDQIERIERVSQWFFENGMDLQPISAETNLDLGVPWNTLTSFVKEQTNKGTAMDLDKLGATVGQIVKIKKRKD